MIRNCSYISDNMLSGKQDTLEAVPCFFIEGASGFSFTVLRGALTLKGVRGGQGARLLKGEKRGKLWI